MCYQTTILFHCFPCKRVGYMCALQSAARKTEYQPLSMASCLRKYIFQVSSKTVNFTHFPLQSSGQVILRGSKIKGNVGTICWGWTVPLSYNQETLGLLQNVGFKVVSNQVVHQWKGPKYPASTRATDGGTISAI